MTMRILTTALAVAVCGWQFEHVKAQETAQVKLETGDVAPVFESQDQHGKPWNSKDFVGKKMMVVYFYPAALTGGCTKQACGFRDDMKKLKELGVEVVGVSGDEVKNLQLFQKAHDLNFTLLADTDGAVAKKFGVPLRDGGQINQTLDGLDYVLRRGVTAARWTFLIDKTGKIAAKNTEVAAAEDSKSILKLLELSKPK